ncbi:2-iminobutanoate/2-iminopropanoate deaminase [Baekduia alba]|uniref:RidA family protein n=1 Tax=Baekduia alba TaxID=2997333 RepID=UPI00233FF582|nr:Rid family hydrolase [Baekduia alba]WCB95211.1 2-iminobutanoate/2-iminopropanoate deaminase [Baekduia alba]
MTPADPLAIEAVPVAPDRFSAYAYSAAIAVGNLLFVSGQSSVDDDGATVGAGDFEAQGHQTFRNLRRALEAGGSSLADVAKVTIFLTDMAHIGAVVALRKRYFTAPYPADSLVEVRALSRPELEIEIEAIAVRRPPAG